jgi:hypothetical protein
VQLLGLPLVASMLWLTVLLAAEQAKSLGAEFLTVELEETGEGQGGCESWSAIGKPLRCTCSAMQCCNFSMGT